MLSESRLSPKERMDRIRGIFESPPGSGVFGARFRDVGARIHRERVGSKAAAILHLQKREREVASGEYVSRSSCTFSRLAKEWLAEKGNRWKPSTLRANELRVQKLNPVIGHTRVDRFTPARIEEILAGLKRSGELLNSTVNLYRFFLSGIFAAGVKRKLIPANPLAQVKKYPEGSPRVRYLSDEEEAKLRKEFVQNSHEWEFDVALNTGVRRGELFFLQWAGVNLEINKIRVDGKTGARSVPLNRSARAALVELRKISGNREFVCPDNDGSAERDWRRWFEIAVKKAGIKNFHYHDVRHTFASRLAMKGESIRSIQELLGHKSLKMTERYMHLSPTHLKAAVEKLVEAK